MRRRCVVYAVVDVVFVLLAVLSLADVVVGGFYEDVDYIETEFDEDSFVEKVLHSPSPWILEFYAPWCPHCKNFQSEFKLAAENLKDLVSFGAVDCDVEKNKPLCGHFKIEALPTLLAFKTILEPIDTPDGQKGFSKIPIKYQGPLKPATIAKWATNFLSDPIDPVTDVTSENIETFLDITKDPPVKALLFSEKEKKSNVLRAVAHHYRKDFFTKAWLTIGQVSHTQTQLLERFGVNTFPTLIVLDEKGEKKDTYPGQFTVVEIKAYLKNYAHEVKPEDLQPNKESSPTPRPPPPPKKPKEIKLHHVTNQESFDSACFPLGLCFIAFLDSSIEDHESYINTLNEVVKKYPSVQVMWLDGPKHESFKSAFGVADYYPQAIAYQRKAKRYRVFMGGFDTDLMGEFIDLVQTGTSKKGRISILQLEPAVGEEEGKEEVKEKEDL